MANDQYRLLKLENYDTVMQFVCNGFPLLNEDIYSDNYFVITCLSNTLKSAYSKLKKRTRFLMGKKENICLSPP